MHVKQNTMPPAPSFCHGYLREDGIAVACIPVFTNVDIEGLERTAVRFIVWVVDETSLPEALLAPLPDEA